MNIGFDLDGVLLDLASYQFNKGNKFFRLFNKTIANYNAYDIEQIYDCSHKLRQLFWSLYIWPYCLFAPAKEDASLIFKKLRDNHTLYLITSRVYVDNDNMLGNLFRFMVHHWLKREDLRFDKDKIIFCSEKNSPIDKSNACWKYNIQFMFEDKPDNIMEISKTTHVLCFDAPYNRAYKFNNTTRIATLLEGYQLIQQYR